METVKIWIVDSSPTIPSALFKLSGTLGKLHVIWRFCQRCDGTAECSSRATMIPASDPLSVLCLQCCIPLNVARSHSTKQKVCSDPPGPGAEEILGLCDQYPVECVSLLVASPCTVHPFTRPAQFFIYHWHNVVRLFSSNFSTSLIIFIVPPSTYTPLPCLLLSFDLDLSSLFVLRIFVSESLWQCKKTKSL